MDRLLDRLGGWAVRQAAESPWTAAYGLARTLLALATASTLAFTPASSLFHEAAGLTTAPFCERGRAASLFCWAGPSQLEVVRWLAVAALLVVATGWRPRVTGLVHWWITWSFQAVGTTIDGGDHLAADLTLLLLPVVLGDPRRWHWQDARRAASAGAASKLVALSGLFMCRLQVAGVYFHAGTGKLAVGEWADGTALYYWFTDPLFGGPPWMAGLLNVVLPLGPVLALATWSVIALELALCAAIIMPARPRAALLWPAILFHAGIALVHGLMTFSVVMTAALILYLRQHHQPFRAAAVQAGGRGGVHDGSHEGRAVYSDPARSLRRGDRRLA